jgi:hypothetical protein
MSTTRISVRSQRKVEHFAYYLRMSACQDADFIKRGNWAVVAKLADTSLILFTIKK